MAGRERLLAIGLAVALSIPTIAVYAEGTTQTPQVYTIAEAEIKNQSGNDVVGKVVCTTTVDTTNTFVKEMELTASVLDKNGKPVEGATYTWVDPYAETAETQNENTTNQTRTQNSNPEKYTAKKSGTYKVTVDLSSVTSKPSEWLSNGELSLSQHPIELSVSVNKIDVTGPTINTVTKNPTDWTKDSVTVTVDCTDVQPVIPSTESTTAASATTQEEPSLGSGLHAQAYSYDGGATWTDQKTTTVTENKNIEFAVRDALGNQTTQTIKVTNIDKTAPTVSLAISDGVLYEGEEGIVTLTASASDAESGLAELPYSWDNGATWYKSPSATVPTIGTFSVLVRDKAGNTQTASVEVKYTQKTDDGSGSTGSGSTGSGSTGSGSTGSGSTGSGSTGSGSTGSGSTGSGSTGSGSTGSGSTSGSTSSSSGNGSSNVTTGNPSWENNSYISGLVTNSEKESSKKETSKKETAETKETSETKETDETKKAKETKQTLETKEGLKTSDTQEDKDFAFPIGLALVVAAILIILSIIILVIKMIFDRRAAAMDDDDDDDEDMSKVYARVHKEAAKTIEAAGATAANAGAENQSAKHQIEASESTDMDVEAMIGASVAEAIGEKEPVIKKIQRVQRESNASVEKVLSSEDEISIGEFAAAAVAAGIAVVDGEKEMEEAISEMEEEKVAHASDAEQVQESVVIEGEHSRLIIDPETGEYKYEFK